MNVMDPRLKEIFLEQAILVWKYEKARDERIKAEKDLEAARAKTCAIRRAIARQLWNQRRGRARPAADQQLALVFPK